MAVIRQRFAGMRADMMDKVGISLKYSESRESQTAA
jgi:hypothetical protein